MPSKIPAVEKGDAALQEQDAVSNEVATQELGSPLEGDPTVDGDVPLLQQQWCRQLAERWTKHNSVSLQLRYDTGESINARIGGPNERQSRGQGVVDALAAAIGTNAGEISRMRWFAHRVPSLKAFCREHPDIRSWDAVKTWLADEARQERGEDQSPKEKTGPVDRFAKSLQAAVKSLPAPEKVKEEEKDDLVYELKKFGRRLKKLGVAITVTELTESAESERETAELTS